MSTVKKTSETISGHSAYVLLIVSGVLIHVMQTVFFYFVHCPVPTIFNIFSTIFYLIMLYCIRLKMYKTSVTCIHLEIMLFVTTTTIFCGWQLGTSLFLLAASGLVYFCPYEHKYIPYIFSTMESLVFVSLAIMSFLYTPIYSHIPTFASNIMMIINTACSFCMLIGASYLTNITASVTNQRLLAENKTLSVMASYDFLTGLFSRRAFLEHLNDINPNSKIVIAMGDLDNFKNINDKYGHSTGDYVLRTFSQLITKYCSSKTIVCRWGGEEFIFYFQNTSFNSAMEEMQTLRSGVASYPFCFDGHSFSVTVTFGLTHGAHSDDIERLISKADSLLYEGKNHGKNQVYFEEN